MIIRSLEPKVKIVVNRNPIKTSFEKWARPYYFLRTIANVLILLLESGAYMLMLTILMVILAIWRSLEKYLVLISVTLYYLSLVERHVPL